MNRMRAGWAIVGVLIAASVAAVVFAVIVSAVTATQIRESQVTNTRTIENTEATLRLIRDCTQPEGDCYQRGQDNTRDVVDNIGLLSAYAAACADQPDTQTADEIQECVLDLIDRPRTKR